MIISTRDIFKMVGIITMMIAAGIICTLFMNYNLDLNGISDLVLPGPMEELYHAQILSGKVLIITTGGCLILTTFVMLIFYIKFYIDSHHSELGVLKALGYSNLRIARSFSKFGLAVLIGTSIGFFLAHLIMNSYYEIQLESGILPTFSPSFHLSLLLMVTILPTAIFSLISIAYAARKLRLPALDLIKGKKAIRIKKSHRNRDLPFLETIRRNTLRSKKSLAFFVGFAAFCFAAMVQMSVSVNKIASEMLSFLMLGIGIVLSVVIIALALSTLMHSEKKHIGLMRVFGYQMHECKQNILNCYHKIVIIGFALGTLYQYVLLQVVVNVVLKDVEVPELNFNIPALIGTIIAFIVLYHGLLFYFSQQIKKLPIKEIMLEAE